MTQAQVIAEITAVLVTHNSAAVLARALRSLPPQMPVVVVDNASSDDTCAIVQTVRPDALLVTLNENQGFGCGMNHGLKRVRTPCALTLNPDAFIAQADIVRLHAVLRAHDDVGLVAPLLRNEVHEEDLSYHADMFTRERYARSPLCPVRYPMPEGPVCAGFLSGAVLLWRAQAFVDTGGFDSHIFLYFEDDDLCLRMRACGYSTVFVPDAVAVHIGGASSATSCAMIRFKERHFAWSHLYIWQKYHARKQGRRSIRSGVYCRALYYALGYGVKALGYLPGPSHKRARYVGRLWGTLEYLMGRRKQTVSDG